MSSAGVLTPSGWAWLGKVRENYHTPTDHGKLERYSLTAQAWEELHHLHDIQNVDGAGRVEIQPRVVARIADHARGGMLNPHDVEDIDYPIVVHIGRPSIVTRAVWTASEWIRPNIVPHGIEKGVTIAVGGWWIDNVGALRSGVVVWG